MTENRKHNLLKLYTPRTPRPKIMALWFLFLFCRPILGISQNKNTLLLPVTSYEISYKEHLGLKYDLANYRAKEVKKKWWYWLPNIGFTFGLPHISFNSNQLAVFDKQNEERKLLQLELHQDYKIQYNEGLPIIRQKYRLIQLKQIELREEIRKFVIKESIYKVEMSAYEKGGTIPLEKLKSELLYQEQNDFISSLEREIEKMILELEVYSFYHFELEEFRESYLECPLDNVGIQKKEEKKD